VNCFFFQATQRILCQHQWPSRPHHYHQVWAEEEVWHQSTPTGTPARAPRTPTITLRRGSFGHKLKTVTPRQVLEEAEEAMEQEAVAELITEH